MTSPVLPPARDEMSARQRSYEADKLATPVAGQTPTILFLTTAVGQLAMSIKAMEQTISNLSETQASPAYRAPRSKPGRARGAKRRHSADSLQGTLAQIPLPTMSPDTAFSTLRRLTETSADNDNDAPVLNPAASAGVPSAGLDDLLLARDAEAHRRGKGGVYSDSEISSATGSVQDSSTQNTQQRHLALPGAPQPPERKRSNESVVVEESLWSRLFTGTFMSGKSNNNPFNSKKVVPTRRMSHEIEAPEALREALHSLSHEARMALDDEPACMVNSESPIAAVVYGFVVLAVMVELIITPYNAAFDRTHFRDAYYVFTTIIFAVDMLLHFFMTDAMTTTFTRTKIALQYVASPFFVCDVLACVPFYLLGPEYALVRLLKVVHFSRASTFWTLTESRMLASFFRVIHLLVVFTFVMHWSACVWHSSMTEEFQEAYSAGDNGWCTDGSVECSKFGQYLTSTVFGLSFLLQLGAYNPTSQKERAVMVGLTLIGACFQASIFGSIAALISGLDMPEHQFRQKIADMSYQMKQLRLPFDLRKRVLGYHEMNWKMSRGEDGINSFVNELSPSLYADVKIMLYRDLVQHIPFIRKCPQISLLFVEALVLKLESARFLPGDLIIRRGEAADWMGFIGRDGRAAVLDPQSTVNKPRILKVLVEGDYIGEMAVFFDTRRTADVQALSWLKVHKLIRGDLEDVMAQYPEDAVHLSKEIRRISRRKFASTLPKSTDAAGGTTKPAPRELAAAGADARRRGSSFIAQVQRVDSPPSMLSTPSMLASPPSGASATRKVPDVEPLSPGTPFSPETQYSEDDTGSGLVFGPEGQELSWRPMLASRFDEPGADSTAPQHGPAGDDDSERGFRRVDDGDGNGR